MGVKGHKPEIRRQTMAKSDSFYIRAEVDTNGVTFEETEIDLGSFVNLGISKSTLLRIHNVALSYLDKDTPGAAINETSANTKVSWQLTTNTQSTIVYPGSDKSVVSSGGLDIFTDGTRTIFVNDAPDINPQNWTNGYLIGVDSLYLATDMSGALDSGDLTIGIVMECTLVNATQANSVALALSQQ
jgi:hypothetical protein